MARPSASVAILALLLGIGGMVAEPVQAQDPEGGNQQILGPGEATGLLTNIDEAGGFIEVAGVRYAVDEGIDLSELSAGQEVTVHYEPSDIPTIPLATEIIKPGG